MSLISWIVEVADRHYNRAEDDDYEHAHVEPGPLGQPDQHPPETGLVGKAAQASPIVGHLLAMYYEDSSILYDGLFQPVLEGLDVVDFYSALLPDSKHALLLGPGVVAVHAIDAHLEVALPHLFFEQLLPLHAASVHLGDYTLHLLASVRDLDEGALAVDGWELLQIPSFNELLASLPRAYVEDFEELGVRVVLPLPIYFFLLVILL